MQRHKPDFLLLFTTLALVAFGIVMVYSSSMVMAMEVMNQSPAYFVKRQTVFAIIGLVIMFGVMNIPYTVWRKWARHITWATVISLALVFVPGIGHKLAGVRRWVGPTALRFQPSELALVGILIYLAYIYEKNGDRVSDFWRGVAPPLTMLGLQFLLILLEPDMGTGMLLLFSGLTVMFAAGIRVRHIIAVGVILTPIVAAFAWFESYRNARLLAFLHPWNPSFAKYGTYQLQQSLLAIYHGGLFGTGIGRGIAPFLYLPIPDADFIFAVIAEELGLVGAIATLGLFALLVWRGIRISQRAPNRFASLLAVGISGLIGFGVLINVGAVTGLMPITGIPLPFISYGGTALIIKLGAMGMLLSISRYTVLEPHGAKRELPSFDAKVRPFQRQPISQRFGQYGSKTSGKRAKSVRSALAGHNRSQSDTR